MPLFANFDLWSFVLFAIIPAAIWFGVSHVNKISRHWLRNVAKGAGWFFGASSSLLLVFALPTGSIDISDLWRFSLYFLLPIVPVCLLALAMWGVIRIAWAKYIVGTVSTVALILGATIFSVLCFAQAGCERRPPALYSQNRLRVALRDFKGQGGLGDDFATVRVRKTWWPVAETVFDGLGTWDRKQNRLTNPEVEWLDSSHLRIRYTDDRVAGDGRGSPGVCNAAVAGVQVLCENTARANAK
jgi:hypothetical protein